MKTKSHPQRTLKVELSGDFAQRKTFPKIRLQGQWLEALGFKPNGRVAIAPTVEGELLLKFIDPQQSESGVSLNETPNLPFGESR